MPRLVAVTVAPTMVAPASSLIVTMRLPLEPCAAIARPDPIEAEPLANVAMSAMRATILRVVK